MRVVYTRSAIADIDHIASYVAERNPRAAVAVVDAIEATVVRIGHFPLSAPATDEPAVRMAPAGRYRYVIFYSMKMPHIRAYITEYAQVKQFIVEDIPRMTEEQVMSPSLLPELRKIMGGQP